MSIIDKDTIWLNADQLLMVFKIYKSKDTMYKAIQRGTFPVKTFKIGKRIYADREAVVEYFRMRKREAMEAHER